MQALSLAAHNGRAADVAALLADGADVNEKTTEGSDYTALHFACMKGHIDIVTTLLAANADVNRRARASSSCCGSSSASRSRGCSTRGWTS